MRTIGEGLNPGLHKEDEVSSRKKVIIDYIVTHIRVGQGSFCIIIVMIILIIFIFIIIITVIIIILLLFFLLLFRFVEAVYIKQQ